jgi:hypothetical protein
MVNVYASFGIVRSPWLLRMRPLEIQGLDNYYVCVLWSFEGHDVLKDAPKTFFCFNTWGTNLGKVMYSYLIQHRYCCQVSMW